MKLDKNWLGAENMAFLNKWLDILVLRVTTNVTKTFYKNSGFKLHKQKFHKYSTNCRISGSHSGGYEVLSSHITPCSPLKADRRFGGTYCHHLQCVYVNHVTNQHETSSRHSWFLAWLSFNLDYEGEMLLRNVGWLLTDYTVLYPKRQNSL
jgi:hypothetical protein